MKWHDMCGDVCVRVLRFYVTVACGCVAIIIMVELQTCVMFYMCNVCDWKSTCVARRRALVQRVVCVWCRVVCVLCVCCVCVLCVVRMMVLYGVVWCCIMCDVLSA